MNPQPSDDVTGPTVVFELGLNHLGDAQRARRMIDALITAGATHITVQVVTDPSRMTRDPSTISLLGGAALSIGDIHALLGYAAERGLVPGATIVDETDVAGLVGAGARFFKILSSDLTYVPLIVAAARTGYPTYLSTAAATVGEIADVLERAVDAVATADLRLIHTVLQIPTPLDQINLRNISMLRERFAIKVAYGQHSEVNEALLAATALGAEALFVYVAEERSAALLDGPHAILCSEARAVLQSIRRTAVSLGSFDRRDDDATRLLRSKIRRSATARQNLPAGHTVAMEDIEFKRPGGGVEPTDVGRIVGRPLAVAVAAGDDIPSEV